MDVKLSVIIVNYNVAHLLKNALTSLLKACEDISTEVFVVDNASADDSIHLIKNEFPSVKLIVNNKNIGFAKANNMAIKQAVGSYILLLNPDTITRPQTIKDVLNFFGSTPDAGAVGVKMINGKGSFLPESKRGLPTFLTAFFYLTGMAGLFKKSGFFNAYHAGHLAENDVNEVDVLTGAFMMLRKDVLKKVGLLDETFFMYGEDIDLSYRLKLAGYKNYYFPKAEIIHFKGQSTNKLSWAYFKNFYGAMFIFVKKYYLKF